MTKNKKNGLDWEKQVVDPQKVIERIEPGMSIFLGTGVGEPRTLVKHLMGAESGNLRDLELIQLVSLADAISLKALKTNTYRLKTFYSGYVAGEAITAGMVDLIPSSFSKIPHLIESGRIPIDVAFVQITPPDEAGYCSLGVVVDVLGTQEDLHVADHVDQDVGEQSDSGERHHPLHPDVGVEERSEPRSPTGSPVDLEAACLCRHGVFLQ